MRTMLKALRSFKPWSAESCRQNLLHSMNILNRREFVILASASATLASGRFAPGETIWENPKARVEALERGRVLHSAEVYLAEAPRTITSAPAPRSAGGLHDFSSEADYWWPDPKKPGGPYIQRDGESNPDNFVAHRQLLMRLSIQTPALTAAFVLTKRRAFAEHAIAQLRAWFVDPATIMNPNLQYAQAIHGIDTGRSIGVIDTLHLVEVAQAALVLEKLGELKGVDLDGTRAWFAKYLEWLTTSDHGKQERAAKNNHGTCWLLQAAAFARFAGDSAVLEECRRRLKEVLLPGQLAQDGSFPLELARTKPFSYSLFNLDVFGMSALVLSDVENDLWRAKAPNGASLVDSFRFMLPYIANKGRWPYKHDVQYWDDLPVRQPSLLFAGIALREEKYFDLWQRLDPDPTVPEVIRNHPVRQPLLWLS